MRIETKYSIGDVVWVIWDNKIQSTKVNRINIECSLAHKGSFGQMYMVDAIPGRWNELKDVFATKDDLIDNLKKL